MEQEDIFKKIISKPLVQAFLIYISSGWIVIEMTDYFINNYNLNDRIRDMILVALLIGLPVTILLTWVFSKEKEDNKVKGKLKAMFKNPWFSIPGVLTLILVLFFTVRYVYLNETGLTKARNISRYLKENVAEVSLAVLPFSNYTSDAEQDWLVDGQQETLINELSKISQVKPLRIISRYTVNSLKDYEKSIPELAQEIDVDFLVEASILGSGDSITLQLRLIQAYPQENVVWAQSFTSDISNILRLHSDIAGLIAQKINLDLSPEDQARIPASRQVNPDSYKAYLRGMYNLNQLTPESTKKGLEYLHEAVRIDPGESFAYAGLALGYLEIAHGPMDTGDALTKAEAAANQAIKLDSTRAEIYAALAEVYLYKTWEFEEAEKYFLKALELNPNLALTHYHYSWALYLFGRMEEAIYEHKLAQKYDPFNPLHTAWLGLLYCYDGQFEEAERVTRESFEIQEDYSAGYFVLGRVYLEMGKTEEAIETHRKLAELYPWWSWALGYTYARTGHIEEAEKIVNGIIESGVHSWKAHGLLMINAALGNKDEAFRWLNYEPHHAFTAWVGIMPEFANLRDDPRFKEFLKRLNLPE